MGARLNTLQRHIISPVLQNQLIHFLHPSYLGVYPFLIAAQKRHPSWTILRAMCREDTYSTVDGSLMTVRVDSRKSRQIINKASRIYQRQLIGAVTQFTLWWYTMLVAVSKGSTGGTSTSTRTTQTVSRSIFFPFQLQIFSFDWFLRLLHNINRNNHIWHHLWPLPRLSIPGQRWGAHSIRHVKLFSSSNHIQVTYLRYFVAYMSAQQRTEHYPIFSPR